MKRLALLVVAVWAAVIVTMVLVPARAGQGSARRIVAVSGCPVLTANRVP